MGGRFGCLILVVAFLVNPFGRLTRGFLETTSQFSLRKKTRMKMVELFC